MLVKIILVIIFVLTFLLAIPNPANASVLFSDNFNDNNISDWTEVRNSCKYNGNKADWKAENGMVGISISGPGCVTELIPSTFRIPADTDYTYSFDMKFPTTINADRNVIFRYKDPNNWYDLKFYSNSLEYQKLIGDYYQLRSTSYAFQDNQTYHFAISYTQTQIVIFINNVKIWELEEAAPFINPTTIGLQASVGSNPSSEVWFDNVKVQTDLSDTLMDVPLLKQTSLPWANQVYDMAQNWSPSATTISRWGCAITSATMVLNYHGLRKLPDGRPLDPGTLNDWLKSQPDGYTRNGLLNWIALTRLSKLSKEINNVEFTALEYTRIDGNLSFLENLLDTSLPAILEETGHFIVAKGYSGQEYFINDPYYNYDSLSSYGNSFHSIRLLKPSSTDLSYIMITSDTDLNINLLSSNNDNVGETYVEGPLINEGFSSNQRINITDLGKPATGAYRLIVSSAQPIYYHFQIFLYDIEGKVKIEEVAGITGGISNDQYLINFNKETKDQSVVYEEINNLSLRNDLELFFALGEINNRGIFTSIVSKINHIEKTNGKNKELHIKSLLNEIKAQKNKGVSQRAYEHLYRKIIELYN